MTQRSTGMFVRLADQDRAARQNNEASARSRRPSAHGFRRQPGEDHIAECRRRDRQEKPLDSARSVDQVPTPRVSRRQRTLDGLDDLLGIAGQLLTASRAVRNVRTGSDVRYPDSAVPDLDDRAVAGVLIRASGSPDRCGTIGTFPSTTGLPMRRPSSIVATRWSTAAECDRVTTRAATELPRSCSCHRRRFVQAIARPRRDVQQPDPHVGSRDARNSARQRSRPEMRSTQGDDGAGLRPHRLPCVQRACSIRSWRLPSNSDARRHSRRHRGWR